MAKPIIRCERCGQPTRRKRFCSRVCLTTHSADYLGRMAHYLARFTDPDVCWLWDGVVDSFGYGRFPSRPPRVVAHRAAWEVLRGPIPDGLCVLHRCDQPRCLNAFRCLFLGTKADNTADMMRKGRARGWFPRTLTPAEIHDIRTSTEFQHTVAARYGIDQSTVSFIRNRKTYKDLP